MHADFRGVEAKGISFDRATLDAANFSGSTINLSLFSYAKIRQASFEACHLTECDFTKAVGAESAWINGHLTYCNFTNAQLDDAVWYGCVLNTPNMHGVEDMKWRSDSKKCLGEIETDPQLFKAERWSDH